jgi:hypothetical protein
VVTYPVGKPTRGRTVRVNGVTGRAGDGAVVWPIAGRYARVRGDLPDGDLLRIAAATTVHVGRPVLRELAGLTVVAFGPFRSPDIREVRYGATALDGASGLGGLIYTGVLTGGGFEDQLYATGAATRRTSVDGKPAVVSSVQGGNGTLAWEPVPGIVAYVGYSGAPLDAAVLAALRDLAGRTQAIGTAQWQSTHPTVNNQVNDYG